MNAKLVKTKNYANVLSSETNHKVEDFRSIMLDTKNEERVEERDKAFREKNIIIHGVILKTIRPLSKLFLQRWDVMKLSQKVLQELESNTKISAVQLKFRSITRMKHYK